MEININTGTASKDELTALIALCASLGGRLPAVGTFAHPILEELYENGTAAVLATREEPTDEGDEQEDGTLDPTKLDTSGVPWDARIHSTPASINKSDGTYRKKRKVNEVYFGQIHGELAEQHASPNLGTGTTTTGAVSPASGTADEQIAPPPPADDEAPPPPVDGPNAQPNQTGTAAGNAPMADASGNAGAATDVSGSRFAGFPAFVSGVNAIRAPQSYPYAELNEIASSLGVPRFADMKDKPDLWETFYGMAGGQ